MPERSDKYRDLIPYHRRNFAKEYKITPVVINENITFDIECEDLVYVTFPGGHGLQCNHEGGTYHYNEIMKLSEQIIENIIKINKLNNL